MARGTWYLVRGAGVVSAFVVCAAAPVRPCAAQARLTVFNAGSLGRPLREALDSFAARNPGVVVAQENAGSLESARKLTELDKIPEVIALADEAVFPALLMPRYTRWNLAFARSEMVLAYTDRSLGASEITPANWTAILLRPNVRIGRSDPALDPNGYRALMVMQLEERRAKQPGLAARLLAAMPERYIRPKESDLIALVQTGDLDYAWSYRSVAQAAGLKYLDLSPEVDLGDPTRAAAYARASISLPGAGPRRSPQATRDTLVLHGAPILYALAVPTDAPDPLVARRFVEWLLSPAGRAILTRNGFTVLDHPIIAGDAPGWVRNLTTGN